MSVKSLTLDLCDCGADGSAVSLSAAMVTTGLVAVAGTLAPDWTFMSIGYSEKRSTEKTSTEKTSTGGKKVHRNNVH